MRDALIDAVGSADGNRQKINTGGGYKQFGFCRVRVGIAAAAVQTVFLSADFSQLCFHRNPCRMAGIRHSLAQADVLLQRFMRAVDHNGGISHPQGFHCQLEAAAVIQMYRNRYACLFRCHFCGGIVIRKIGIPDGGRRRLQDHGGAQFLRGGHHRLNHLHIFHIECTYGISLRLGIQ